MSNYAIRAVGLGKQYRIGTQEARHDTLGAALSHAVRAPFRNLKRLRSMSDFRVDNGDVVWAVRDVSFDVRHGEVLGIIGRNGAGKSTLLKVLSRITYPSAGRADVYGRVGSLLEVGTGFHPELTGRENVYLNGSILGMDRQYIDRRFDEIVEFSGVERFVDTPVKRYSSGMYLRLAFAVAAHLEPEVLVVDEVLAVGDAEFQRKCLGKMEEVAEQGRTVLFVSHNMPALTRLCTRAIRLQDGRLVEDGPVDEVVSSYLRGAGEQSGARSWEGEDAPGTDEVRLRAVELVDDAGDPISVASVAERIHLRLSYDVGTPGVRFRCAAMFYTQGVCAFATVEPYEAERAERGSYTSTVTVPAHLLAEGEYTVGVSIFTSRGMKTHYVRAGNVATVLLTDPIDGSSARGDYVQTLVGVVRPKLHWSLEAPGAREPRVAPASSALL